MTRPVAPYLTALLAEQPFDGSVSAWNGPALDREFRALLAVASAAAAYDRTRPGMAPGISCVCHGQEVCAGCSLVRALSRLRRLSPRTTRAARTAKR